MLTRPREREHLVRAARGLQFLVLDELHAYRGRQGADVAFLVRRVRDACEASDLQCVGTSATMTSGGSLADQRRLIAGIASRMFGAEVTGEWVIGETLERATRHDPPSAGELRHRVARQPNGWTYDAFVDDPLAAWVETAFGVDRDPDTGQLVRRKPITVTQAAHQLAEITAMRRRFAFVPLHPAEEPVRGLLGRWLAKRGYGDEPAQLLAELNRRMADYDYAIGPSYLMRPSVTGEGGLERIWRTSIMPLLEELHYGEPLDLDSQYGLAALRKRIAARAAPGTEE